MSQTVCIVGAGPAGLTAAYELLKHTGLKPMVIEADSQVGGLSKTVRYKGNRIDIGGHRFFSKSRRVMDFWQEILPTEHPACRPADQDRVMLLRRRLSRILFRRDYYDYPLTLNGKTLRSLGLKRTSKIGMSYLVAKLNPITPELSLADFFSNRFGRELYATFFKDYTEKVWGVPCSEIPRDWGAQRVKGLSVTGAVWHALRKPFINMDNRKVETSLIGQFHYPKYGPGQLWEEVARRVTDADGSIQLNSKVVQILLDGNMITGVVVENAAGARQRMAVDFLFSSMPVRELIAMLPGMPRDVQAIARGLPYRDFVTVGILFDKGQAADLPDNWIYVQEQDLKIGRIQVFNNWSPYLVENERTLWLGLEYFCQENDGLWSMTDGELRRMAVEELLQTGIINDAAAVLDATVLRVKKAYPAYFGTYAQFARLQSYLARFRNLFLIGRNGQHRYNNMDHSMLTAMTAVDVLAGRQIDRQAVWRVNTGESYHEQK